MESRDSCVFGLITDLCNKVIGDVPTRNDIPKRKIISQMRTLAYELLLKKSKVSVADSKREPYTDLWTYYFVLQQSSKNVADHKRSTELKSAISTIKSKDFGDKRELVDNVLKLLTSLSSQCVDSSLELYQSPFSFGLLNDMLPRFEQDTFGSPEPYQYYPSHIFELPFSLNNSCNKAAASTLFTPYKVESFDSRSKLPITQNGVLEIKSFISPMSLSSNLLAITDSSMFDFPRNSLPRDLAIPQSQDHVKVTLAPSEDKNLDIKEVFRAEDKSVTPHIWEVVSRMDKDISDDIWDEVSKLPQLDQRNVISMSKREMALWEKKYSKRLGKINVITEKEFIRHIMYLVIGVETKSFYCGNDSIFYMATNLALEGVSIDILEKFIIPILDTGSYYKRLHDFAFGQFREPNLECPGLTTEALKEALRCFLLKFRLKATSIFENCFTDNPCTEKRLPLLLQIMHRIEGLSEELETMAKIMKMGSTISQLPEGGELLSYLYDKTSMITHREASLATFTLLFSVCKVYFKFIEKFIFEGDLDDLHGEFFIKTDPQHINSRTKKYWDSGFFVTFFHSVPDFLKSLTRCILLCGKTLRLFKLCNPGDPLALLISSDHPSVKCCSSFEELNGQQRVLDVYRTRCLFVSGQRATFEQILLKREAERKAFTEMASVKQAETMEKIVAERKRLAQLIMAEKQHSFKVLEAAMLETQAAKNKRSQRERVVSHLETAADKIVEEVDAKLVEGERKKIMEYYSNLNLQVEKSQRQTEWKIKRLQLNETRIQLLSTEERNLKHEKREIDCNRSGVRMSMSIHSDKFYDAKSSLSDVRSDTLMYRSLDSIELRPKVEYTASAPVIVDTTNLIDNAASLDKEGNILPVTEANKTHHTTSSNIIGNQLNSKLDNIQYLQNCKDANANRLKVLTQEMGDTDRDNNIIVRLPSVDDDNNIMDGTAASEAIRNRTKVLGDGFHTENVIKTISEPRTDAQKEAVRNKLKVLGVEYNLHLEPEMKREPQNIAQEEAVRNRSKILDSDLHNLKLMSQGEEVHAVKEPQNIAQEEAIRNRKKVLLSDLDHMRGETATEQGAKRAALTLNLKPISATDPNTPITPYNLASTPDTAHILGSEMYSGLDIETPTTAEIPVINENTNDDTPKSDPDKSITVSNFRTKKDYLSSSGFNFSLLDDDLLSPEMATDSNTESVDNTPIRGNEVTINYGNISPACFDPFGLKQFDSFSKDVTDGNPSESSSFYTSPVLIMQEAREKPNDNIFYKHFGSKDDDDFEIDCNNISTLTACLQRSVMLPLTYQLEVVNSAILNYFLVNLDMYDHLRSLKDYFFLGDGEFSRSICHNLFVKLRNTLNPEELLNFATLPSILDKALGSSISHVNKFSENLSFAIVETPLAFQHSSPDVLQCLTLTYSVEWPLNIILSNEALSRYAKVFQFLLKMRRIAWVLGQNFENLKQLLKLSRERHKLQRSPHYITLQLYRHNMASLVRALDSYIVTTCIQTSWKELESDLKKSRTLDDLYECHVVYVKKVLFRCLLNNRSTPVMKLLNDIFTVILKFSRVLQAGQWHKNSDGQFNHQCFPQLDELYHIFEKLTKYLHAFIVRLMECGYQRHLVELLTMINWNGYYDKSKSKSDASVAPSNLSLESRCKSVQEK